MTAYNAQRTRRIGETNRRELRAKSTRAMSALLALATLLFWWSLLSQRDPTFRSVLVSFALIPVFVLSWHLYETRPRLAHGLLLAGCLIVASEASRTLPIEAVVPLLILPGVVAFGVFGAGSGLIIAGLALLLSPLELRGPDLMVIAGAVLVLLSVLAVIGPRENVLEWSWRRSAEAIDLAEQLRDRQGELNKALSALHVAYQLLERSNRELAEAHQDAEEARRLKEEFAANVSHELRTPLNIILGFADILYRTPGVYGDLTWPPILRRDVSEIWRSARYISELVDDILELARVDALRMPVTREMSDLASVVVETAELADRLTDGKTVSLRVELPDDLPPVYLDRTRIRQVLLNLLTNAIRFTDDGTVTISVVRGEDEIQVTVSDTGVGIAHHELDTVFREFHRAEGPQQRGGKGLGLAIARRFVQLHGGRIWAESEIGHGSQFHFTLPLGGKRVSKLTGSSASPFSPGHTGPVLVLNGFDDTRAFDLLRRHLDGFEVVVANGEANAVDLVERLHPRAVMVEGPEGVVRGYAEQVAEMLPPHVCVVSTSLEGETDGSPVGPFIESVAKPVESEELVRVVSKYLREGSVLVVDDDRAFVQMVRRILQAWTPTLTVRWAYDGEEALARLRECQADLVLVDIVMQPMTGTALAESIRRDPRLSGIPIVAISGAQGLPEDARVSWIQVAKRGGMRDSEALTVLRSLLQTIRSDYVISARAGSAPT